MLNNSFWYDSECKWASLSWRRITQFNWLKMHTILLFNKTFMQPGSCELPEYFLCTLRTTNHAHWGGRSKLYCPWPNNFPREPLMSMSTQQNHFAIVAIISEECAADLASRSRRIASVNFWGLMWLFWAHQRVDKSHYVPKSAPRCKLNCPQHCCFRFSWSKMLDPTQNRPMANPNKPKMHK